MLKHFLQKNVSKMVGPYLTADFQIFPTVTNNNKQTITEGQVSQHLVDPATASTVPGASRAYWEGLGLAK